MTSGDTEGLIVGHDVENGHPPSPPPGFEGPEKRLELDFLPAFSDSSPRGMRNVTRAEWEEVLSIVKCEVLGVRSNKYFDAYLLSESSMFVYPNKVIIKTCGTTTLLLCLDELIAQSRRQSMKLDFLMYSRKNFLFPENQVGPHRSFEEEIALLDRFQGAAYVLGPLTSDHWYLYLANFNGTTPKMQQCNQIIEIMMHELHPKVMAHFFQKEDAHPIDVLTTRLGIHDFIPGSKLHEYFFQPCGYSNNGMCEGSYSTVHVTPEEHCSYVSFETNAPRTDYREMIQRVLDTFQPAKFTLVVQHGVDSANFKGFRGYRLMHCTQYEFEGHYKVAMANFRSTLISSPSLEKRRHAL